MKKNITVATIAAIAVIALFGSCSKDRACKCDPETATEHWQIVTVDRSMKCDQIHKLSKEHKVDNPSTGRQTLDHYEVVPVSCIDYEE